MNIIFPRAAYHTIVPSTEELYCLISLILLRTESRTNNQTTYNPNFLISWNHDADEYVVLSPNVDRFAHSFPKLRGSYDSTACHVRAVTERYQGRGGGLPTDDNLPQERGEIGLVEMHDDVIAPGRSGSRNMHTFLKTSREKCYSRKRDCHICS